MINELIFILHTLIISVTAIIMLRLGKEALIAFICLQNILANFFVIKAITLFNLTATGLMPLLLVLYLAFIYYKNFMAERLPKKLSGSALGYYFFTS